MRWATYVSPTDHRDRPGVLHDGAIHGLPGSQRLIDLLGDDGTALAEAAQRALADPFEVVAEPDNQAVEIVIAFHTTLRAIIMGRVSGEGGKHGNELAQALEAACTRYFEHFPGNRAERDDSAEF